MYIIICRHERAASASEEIPLCAVPLQTRDTSTLSYKGLLRSAGYSTTGTAVINFQ